MDDNKIKPRITYTAEAWRKALHGFALLLPVAMAVAGRRHSMLFLVPLATLAVVCDVLRVRSAGFSTFVQRFFGFLLRAEERQPLGGPITLTGGAWVLVSAALLTIIFPVRIAVAALAMSLVSDAAAALVGRRYGRTTWSGGARTHEGSLAFLVAGVAVMALLPTVIFWKGALSVVAATLAEIPRGFLNDNLRVPMVAALVLYVLERFAVG